MDREELVVVVNFGVGVVVSGNCVKNTFSLKKISLIFKLGNLHLSTPDLSSTSFFLSNFSSRPNLGLLKL